MISPEVSVVMSVYNGELYLAEAIDSILKQTFQNFEFIIVNDGSTDKTAEILTLFRDPRISILNQENLGLAVALNNGIRKSSTSYIARMDADDVSMPDRLEKQINFLKKDTSYILVGSNAEVMDSEGKYIYSSDLSTTWDEINSNFPESSFFHSSVMFAKEAFIKCGGYTEIASRLYSFEDSILWNKMRSYGKMANLKHCLLKYRLVPGAATSKSGKESMIANEVLAQIIKTDRLSEEDRIKLLSLKKSMSGKERTFVYHIHIAKKFLWNNYSFKNSLRHCIAAIKTSPGKREGYFYLLLSFLPPFLIQNIYKNFKRS